MISRRQFLLSSRPAKKIFSFGYPAFFATDSVNGRFMSTEILAPLCASVPLHNALRAKKYILFQKPNLILKDYSMLMKTQRFPESRQQLIF